MKTIRIYTPQFQALIDTFINEGLDAIAESLINKPEGLDIELDAEGFINRDLITHNVTAVLEAFWFQGGNLPEGMAIPIALEFPEFVTYNYEQDEVGQPLIPGTLPDCFIIQPMSNTKVNQLQDWIDDEVPLANMFDVEHMKMGG